jgi:hypothetical protein
MAYSTNYIFFLFLYLYVTVTSVICRHCDVIGDVMVTDLLSVK